MTRLTLASAALLLALPAARAEGPATDKLPEMVVTATRTVQPRSEAPIRTEVITPSETEKRDAVTLASAVELLNGVRVEPVCQNHGSTDVQMLGLGGGYNQILFDGLPVLSALGADCGVDRIATVFGDRIEVVKGGGSALYGANAVAGVINLVPVSPTRTGGFVGGGVDVQKDVPLWHTEARGDAVSENRKVAVSLFGQYGKNDAVDFNGDGFSEIAQREFSTAGTRLQYAPNDSTRLRAEYQYTGEERRGGNDFNRPEYAANIAELNDTQFHRLALNWDQQLDSDLDFSLGYAMSYVDRDSYYGGVGDPSESGYDPVAAAAEARNLYGHTTNPLHFLDSRLNWHLGDHLLTLGVQYKHESVVDRNLDLAGNTLATLADRTYHDTGLILQDRWRPAKNLELLPGIRTDFHSELDSPVVSPRLAAHYKPVPTLTLRPSVSTGFRAPEPFSEDFHVNTLGNTPVRVVNEPGLSAEKSLTGMFGVEWNSSEKDPLLTWDITGSFTNIDDTFLISRETTPAGVDIDRRTNSGGSTVAGAESNITVRPHRMLAFTVGAAYYDSRYKESQTVYDDGAGTTITTRDYLKTPKWTGVAKLDFMPADGWDLFAALRYTGPMEIVNNRTGTLNDSTPEFWVLDLGLLYKFDLGDTQSLAFTAGVKNVLDDRQKDLESGPGRDSDYFYGPRNARTFYAGVKYSF